ncbi:alpha/beta hydrolase domain-containing protein VTE7-like isoform X1 [Coffea arabica]|uniref:Alpha/beta hydrolase domain-containing protein VTE7-like isoform X1 n=1 Tax=Coffea arabica TaxID=13443 RepID=A0A6P6TK07_COFAR
MPVLLPITTLVFSFTTSSSQLLPPSASTPALIQRARERFGSKHSMHLGVNCGGRLGTNVIAVDGEFPSFLPKEVKEIKDPFARTLAQRIQRLPVKVGFSDSCIMSSCVKPRFQHDTDPVVLLHCFDSSCLEWRCTYPLLEDAALETWAIDILGWGFSDLDFLPAMRHPKDIIFTRCFGKITSWMLLWRTHIKRPMILVGPSLGAAVAIDFAINFPEAVDKLILINASVYAEGTGLLTKLPKFLAYAGVSLLKSLPLRLYANLLAFDDIPLSKCFDWANVGRLHCLLPWWEDATVNYMLSGGYNVVNQIKQVNKKVLVIWGECDNIVNSKLAMRLHGELPDASVHQIPDCGHLPHVEKPEIVARLIADFARPGAPKEEQEPIVLNSVDGKNTFLFNVLRVENA